MQRVNVFVAHPVRVKKILPEGLRKLIKPELCVWVSSGWSGLSWRISSYTPSAAQAAGRGWSEFSWGMSACPHCPAVHTVLLRQRIRVEGLSWNIFSKTSSAAQTTRWGWSGLSWRVSILFRCTHSAAPAAGQGWRVKLKHIQQNKQGQC